MATKDGSQMLKLPIMSGREINHFARFASRLAQHNERLALMYLISSQSGNKEAESSLDVVGRRIQHLESGLATVESSVLARKVAILAANAVNVMRAKKKSLARTQLAIALLNQYEMLRPDVYASLEAETSLLRHFACEYEEVA